MSPATCLRPGCGEPPICRGLCARCYRIAHELVTDGRTTWAALVRAKRARPADGAHRRQRVRKGAITTWFLKGGRR